MIARSQRVHLASALCVSALAAGLTGCGALHPEDFPKDGPRLTATANPQAVTRSDFGRSWNLPVDGGTVTCQKNGKGDPILQFVTPEGKPYALNAVEGNDAPPIDEIATGPVGTLRSFSFTVCDAAK